MIRALPPHFLVWAVLFLLLWESARTHDFTKSHKIEINMARRKGLYNNSIKASYKFYVLLGGRRWSDGAILCQDDGGLLADICTISSLLDATIEVAYV